jgi:hypothetical protein
MISISSRAPRRGSSGIKKIVIKGFELPLIVEDGKRIKNWTTGLRTQLKQEASKFGELVKQSIQQNVLFHSNDFSVSFRELEETDNEWLNWNCLNRDESISNNSTDSLLGQNDDPLVFIF